MLLLSGNRGPFYRGMPSKCQEEEKPGTSLHRGMLFKCQEEEKPGTSLQGYAI